MSSNESESTVLPGQVLAGKYRIERLLGEGGHGIVVAAQHLTLGERVAIKLLKKDVAEDTEAVSRFLREARASVRIKGEHVTRVLDVGSTSTGLPYMVMEHLVGNDLASIVDTKGWLPVSLAVDYILQTCEALAEAHGLGIVHRDIKPSNLFLTTRTDGSPCIKVLDFGISKAMPLPDGTAPEMNLTQTQTVLGSPQYMAPEQMRSSRKVDLRTDIWAIGTTLHELLTGRPPFEAQTMPGLFAMILQDPAPRLSEKRPEMPEALELIVQRCLEKDAAKRFTDVHELARALAPLASSSGALIAERIGRVGFNASRSSDRLLPIDAGSAPGVDLSRTDKMNTAPFAPKSKTAALAVAALATFLTMICGVGIFFGVRQIRGDKRVQITPTVSVAPASAEPLPTTVILPAATASSPEEASSALLTSASASPPTPTPAPAPKKINPRIRPLKTAAATPPATSTPPTPAPKPTETPRPPGVASSRYD